MLGWKAEADTVVCPDSNDEMKLMPFCDIEANICILCRGYKI